MKNLLLVVFTLVFISATAFANVNLLKGEVNVKSGWDFLGNLCSKSTFKYRGEKFEQTDTDKANMGVSLTAEYLVPLDNLFKVGAGLEYVFPREMWDSYNEQIADPSKESFLPVYLTIQINPLNFAKEIFFKANLGYTIIFQDDYNIAQKKSEKCGLYCALGIG